MVNGLVCGDYGSDSDVDEDSADGDNYRSRSPRVRNSTLQVCSSGGADVCLGGKVVHLPFNARPGFVEQ